LDRERRVRLVERGRIRRAVDLEAAALRGRAEHDRGLLLRHSSAHCRHCEDEDCRSDGRAQSAFTSVPLHVCRLPFPPRVDLRAALLYHAPCDSQSARAPDDWITRPHFSASTCMNLRSSSGEPPTGCAPWFASCARTSGAASVATRVWLSFARISRGVPAGATTACQDPPCSAAKPTSGVAGTSGRSGERAGAVITSAFRRPALTCGRKGSEEHTSELQSRFELVCRLLPEKKKRRFLTRGATHASDIL